MVREIKIVIHGLPPTALPILESDQNNACPYAFKLPFNVFAYGVLGTSMMALPTLGKSPYRDIEAYISQ